MGVIHRREAIRRTGAATVGSLMASSLSLSAGQKVVSNGRLKQSVSRWPYAKIPLPDFCRAIAEMGLPGIDLMQPEEFDVVRQYGLVCSMGYADAGSIPKGLNDPANHDAIVAGLTKNIPIAAKAGVPNVITFFGNRRPGLDDATAISYCVDGLNRVKQIAEDSGVTICVELLNSRVDHNGYQGDRTAFGVAVVKGVNSPRVKLLYDIYHMQIMEGDVMRTIRSNIEHIAHFHTGGVPGRHELDATQELQWASVCRAIADLNFKGYIAHEFVPTRDPLTSLREAVALCDV